jgi:hypothetical protein
MQFVPRQRVDRAERLVHQQHGRLRGERARDRRALLHPARELPWVALFGAFEADRPQVAGRLRARRGTRRPRPVLDREGDVVADRAPRKQRLRVLLEKVDDAGRRRADRRAAKRRAAAARRQEPRGDLQQRRLAAARGADDRDEFTFADVERDPRERFGPLGAEAVALRDVGEAQRGRLFVGGRHG